MPPKVWRQGTRKSLRGADETGEAAVSLEQSLRREQRRAERVRHRKLEERRERDTAAASPVAAGEGERADTRDPPEDRGEGACAAAAGEEQDAAVPAEEEREARAQQQQAQRQAPDARQARGGAEGAAAAAEGAEGGAQGTSDAAAEEERRVKDTLAVAEDRAAKVAEMAADQRRNAGVRHRAGADIPNLAPQLPEQLRRASPPPWPPGEVPLGQPSKRKAEAVVRRLMSNAGTQRAYGGGVNLEPQGLLPYKVLPDAPLIRPLKLAEGSNSCSFSISDEHEKVKENEDAEGTAERPSKRAKGQKESLAELGLSGLAAMGEVLRRDEPLNNDATKNEARAQEREARLAKAKLDVAHARKHEHTRQGMLLRTALITSTSGKRAPVENVPERLKDARLALEAELAANAAAAWEHAEADFEEEEEEAEDAAAAHDAPVTPQAVARSGDISLVGHGGAPSQAGAAAMGGVAAQQAPMLDASALAQAHQAGLSPMAMMLVAQAHQQSPQQPAAIPGMLGASSNASALAAQAIVLGNRALASGGATAADGLSDTRLADLLKRQRQLAEAQESLQQQAALLQAQAANLQQQQVGLGGDAGALGSSGARGLASALGALGGGGGLNATLVAQLQAAELQAAVSPRVGGLAAAVERGSALGSGVLANASKAEIELALLKHRLGISNL